MGPFCSVAAGVKVFLGGEHRTDWVSTYPFTEFWPEVSQGITGHPLSRGDVVIGHDVWIGTEAMIMSGVRIGNGAVIGARAVVTKDVPHYAIVAGNPARVIRNRFSDDVVDRLQRLAWWDWDDKRIERFLPMLLSGDVERFLLSTEGGDRSSTMPARGVGPCAHTKA